MKFEKYLKNGILILCIVAVLGYLFYRLFSVNDTIKIHIGYQSVTSQTWGALIIKNQKIFEKKLEEQYPSQKFEIIWHDEISGAVINTNMISNKYQFGFMGDMPLLLNMYKASTMRNYNSVLVAFDGKGTNGKNQSILIPQNSKTKTIKDLKGKTISTPIGSSAHFMLMKILEKYDLLDQVNIVHQDVALASQLLSTNKTDAFAIWSPYPNFLTENNYGKILIDGSESNSDYLNGVIVNRNWANENEEILQLFIESLNEAHKYIKSNPSKSAEIFSNESGFSYNITLKEVENIDWDSTINDDDVKTLEEKMDFLINLEQIKWFDLKEYIYN